MTVTEPSSLIPPPEPDKQRAGSVPAKVLAREAIVAIQEKKAHDVVTMDMRATSGLADYFVLCSATSDLQVKAITESVQTRLKHECNELPWHIEGAEHRQWVLLDYVDLVVHIFTPERRAFYDLERLWSDAPTEIVGNHPVAILDP